MDWIMVVYVGLSMIHLGLSLDSSVNIVSRILWLVAGGCFALAAVFRYLGV